MMLSNRPMMSGLIVGGAATLAMAADPAHGEGSINLFGGDWGVAIWTLLIFALVVVVLAKFAWGPMLSGLQKREKFIRDSLEQAKHDREQAEARLHEYERKLRESREEASAIVEEGRRDAEAVRKRIQEEARQSSEQILERAKREIAIARDTVLKDLYDQSAELAMQMAGSVLKRQLTPEDQQQLIQETLADLRKNGSGAN